MGERAQMTSKQHRTVRFTRLAEQIADDLRTRILVGDLADETGLPVEEQLREQYDVSKPTLREAMRVLEAEGLVTVRRGSIGGSVIHRPTAENVAYTLGLVLASHQAELVDVGVALAAVEPACAAACARRPDRDRAVVPLLQELHDRSLEVVDDLVEATTASRAFHEAVVQHCGNISLSVLAGALESLWSTFESAWAHRVPDAGEVPRAERVAALMDHARLIELIHDGDAEGARRHSAEHLAAVQTYPTRQARTIVEPLAVRDSFVDYRATSD